MELHIQNFFFRIALENTLHIAFWTFTIQKHVEYFFAFLGTSIYFIEDPILKLKRETEYCFSGRVQDVVGIFKFFLANVPAVGPFKDPKITLGII